MQINSWRRIHSASGLVPLAAYLVFHAWQLWPVRSGRDALFARLSHASSGWLEGLLVLVPLLVHGVLGLVLARRVFARSPEGELRHREIGPYASLSFRRLQLASGLVTALFLVHHVWGVWLPRLSEENPLGASYSATLAHTGTLFGIVVYVVGTGAVCTHFGQGLGACLLRWYPACPRPRTVRIVGVVFGVLLWLSLINELASYASSGPLL